MLEFNNVRAEPNPPWKPLKFTTMHTETSLNLNWELTGSINMSCFSAIRGLLYCLCFTVILTSYMYVCCVCFPSCSPDQGCDEAVWRRVRAAVRGGPLQQRPLRDRRGRKAAVAAASQKGQYCCAVCVKCVCSPTALIQMKWKCNSKNGKGYKWRLLTPCTIMPISSASKLSFLKFANGFLLISTLALSWSGKVKLKHSVGSKCQTWTTSGCHSTYWKILLPDKKWSFSIVEPN